MNETDYNARLYEKMKADWQEDGVKVSKGAKSLSILEPVEYAKGIRAELSKTRSAMNEIGSRVSEEIYRRRAERSKEQER